MRLHLTGYRSHIANNTIRAMAIRMTMMMVVMVVTAMKMIELGE